MNGFVAFIRKEFFHIFRDKRTMLIVLCMPVVQIVLFGFALSTEIHNVDLVMLAPERTEMVRQLAEQIDANDYFTFRRFVTSSEEANEALQSGEADIVLVWEQGFEKNLFASGKKAEIQIITDASNPMSAQMGMGYLQSVLSGFFSGRQQIASPPAVQLNLRMLYNPQMKSAYNFVPGIMGLIFIIVCAVMTSVSIVREKETGTMEVLLVSPVKPIHIVLAKMIPYFTVSCINLGTILLLAYFVLEVPMEGGLIGLCVVSFFYIFLSLALGLLISTLVDKQVTAMLLSIMLLMLPVVMLSGMLFPIENMPGILQGLSCIVPARWYISAVRKLMIEGLPFHAVWMEALILFGMSSVLIGVALKKFKKRLE